MNHPLLTYPFDPQLILKKRRAIRRELLASGGPWLDKKVAILGGSTTHDIREMLELFLLDQGIRPTFYESEFGQYWEDATFGSPGLDALEPDVIFVHTSTRNILRWPAPGDGQAEAEALAEDTMSRLEAMWDKLADRWHCPVIQNNFELPHYRLMGNREAVDWGGRVAFVHRLNARMAEYARTHSSFYVNDLMYLAADFGLSRWADPLYWHMYKYCLCLSAIPALAFSVSNLIKAIYGRNRKALALDLDNTLWGGVVGDDGVEGIVVGHETSMGQVYSEFQGYLKELKGIGVVLNVDSKNDLENALAGLNHPEGTLRPDDFISIQANWQPKDQNLRAMADQLSLTPDAFVFVDDNPAERAIVAAQVPGAAVPEMGKPEDYLRVLDRSGFFEVVDLSADDLKRNEMYRANAQRARLEASFASYDDYLRSLEMTAVIRDFEPVYLARITQLTNKSNQFNLTTRRYTEAEMEQAASDPELIRLYGKLTDKFGDNGVITVVIGRQEGETVHIQLWLMSCRVLKRNMEHAMLDALAAQALARGARTLRGYYYKTAKNKMVEDFYAGFGFTLVERNGEDTVWELDLTGYQPQNHVIKVVD